ncbi:MAG: HIT domain-containing protein [Alphaproteobacteria bacterium]|nr:HIT domain-containing protein [Alphaproteobacteria bacterium]MDA7983385.1 HIT domain-containing protein [Alphaproteobacteria bacterium]MDA7984137.1 HIT domain-containing protein [Alphaproteobacteria bacterium]MDA7987446.1 HIT domain-containing protein [Alphaproteobacteria bacterium]MDA7988878.1 HIT domain-containing protein [Alphaproteobacteria bacterium]
MAYDDQNIFAQILAGKIPCKEVYKDEHVLAFHDIQPQAPVHVLFLPRGAYESSQDFYASASPGEITALARAVAAVAERLGVVKGGYRLISNHRHYAGQEVPHFHIHLLGGAPLGPMTSGK